MLNRLIKKNNLAFLIFAFLSLRIIQLCTSLNRLYHPNELILGYLARDISINNSISIFNYQYPPDVGGQLIASIIFVPFYFILGNSIISIKLVEVLFWVASIIIWYLFCEKFFEKPVTFLLSLFLILSPPLLIRASLITAGQHHETIFLSIVAIFLFYNMLFDEKKYTIVFLGLFCGFSLYFTSMSLIMLVACVLYWIILAKARFVRKSLIFSLFFLIGILPEIWFSYTYRRFQIAGDPYTRIFFSGSIVQLLSKLKNLIAFHLLNAFSFNDFYFIKGKYLSAVYYSIFIFSYFLILWTNRKALLIMTKNVFRKTVETVPPRALKEAFFIFFPIIYFLIYAISNRKIGHGALNNGAYRYLIVLFPIMIMTISLALNKLRLISKKFFLLITLVLCLAGVAGNLEYINPLNFNKNIFAKIWKYKAVDYRYFGWLTAMNNLPPKIDIYLEKIRGFKSPEDLLSFYIGTGYCAQERFHENPSEWVKIIDQLSKFDQDFKVYCFKGFIADKEDQDFLADIINQPEKWISIIEKVEPEYRKYCYEALGIVIATYDYDKHNKNNIKKKIELVNQSPSAYKGFCFKGFGKGIGEIYWWDQEHYNKIASHISLDYINYFYVGIGKAFAEIYSFDIKKIKNAINRLISQPNRLYCYKGLREIVISTFTFDKQRMLDLMQEIEI